MDDLKFVFESDDDLQQQSQPKRGKSKYEGLKVVELRSYVNKGVWVALESKSSILKVNRRRKNMYILCTYW